MHNSNDIPIKQPVKKINIKLSEAEHDDLGLGNAIQSSAVKWWHELFFMFICFGALIGLLYEWHGNMAVTINVMAISLFALVTILIGRLLGLKELIGGIVNIPLEFWHKR